MARTELPNGVILPAEYSDDWYDDMTSNLTKLDDVIGSDSEKLNADGVYFLRMSSAALTDSGTGNFSDLNSSYKIKTGDLVLDSDRKLYQIVSVDSTNETFTVGNSLFKVTAESDLAPVAESGDYDDLTDLPTYGITRLCSSAITDNSTVAFSAISSTNKIKAGDFLLDTNGKLYQISSVDTANESVSVTTPLTQLAVDSGVMHLSGNETANGEKTFNDLQIICYGTQYKGASNAYILPEFSAGYSGLSITTLSYSQTLKIGNFVLDSNNKPTLDTSKAYIQIATGENSGVNTCVLEPRNSTDSLLGTSSNKWKQINGLTPSSLSMPSGNASDVIDISGYITILDGSNVNTYVAPANGWISILMNNCSSVQGYITGLWGHQIIRPSVGSVRFFMPVLKNRTVNILVLGGTIGNARFIPCQGNV